MFHIFFTVKFVKDLRRKLELELPPLHKSFAHYFVKSKWSTIQLTIDADFKVTTLLDIEYLRYDKR